MQEPAIKEQSNPSHEADASCYDSYDYSTFWRGRDYEYHADIIALKKFLRKIPATAPHEYIIDVGAGLGRLVPYYAPHFAKAIFLDPSVMQLQRSQEALGKAYPHISFLQGTAQHIPLPDASADVIVCVRVSHHIPDFIKPIEEFARVLKPGGYLILEIANKIHMKSRVRAYMTGKQKELHSFVPAHVHMYKDTMTPFVNHHPQAIKQDLQKAGFRVITHRSVSNLRSPLLKKIIPTFILIALEYVSQHMLVRWQFGPSVFFLAQKK